MGFGDHASAGRFFCNFMARLTVEQIMTQIAATVNQEATPPTAGSAEYLLWLNFVNRSMFEWAEASDWEELRKRFLTSVSGVCQATVSLPLDFRKLAAAPRLHTTSGAVGGEEWPESLPEENGLANSIDKYFNIIGNPSEGYSFNWFPATLASGASIDISYFSMPTSLASPSTVSPMSDPQYLIDRSIAFILEGRSDPRFQAQETKAREKLLGMVENANLAKFTSYAGSNYVANSPERKMGFRIGRD